MCMVMNGIVLHNSRAVFPIESQVSKMDHYLRSEPTSTLMVKVQRTVPENSLNSII